MIMPRRVVFEGAKFSHELNLANTGSDSANYVISLVHYRMKEDGSIEEMAADDSSGNFADPYVRIFPRRVTLAPNEAQSVRIQLTQTKNLANGEYRSHLYFRAVPNNTALGEKETTNAGATGISVQIKPVFGIAIPVIIRAGEATTKVGLANCSFEMLDANTPILKMTLLRTGNMSAYGDITVDHISPIGKVTRVGIIKGLAVYTPNEMRHVKMSINEIEGVDYTRGKLHIIYQAQENANYTNTAQSEVYLN